MHLLTVKKQIHARDEIAALLSVVPGLGHLYKGRYGMGFTIMFALFPLAVYTGVLMSLVTLGFGMLIPLGVWAAVGYHAFLLPDHRKIHPLV